MYICVWTKTYGGAEIQYHESSKLYRSVLARSRFRSISLNHVSAQLHLYTLDLDVDIEIDKHRADMGSQTSVGVGSAGATTKSSKAVVSKGEGPQTHYSLMSSTPMLSLPLPITLHLHLPLLLLYLLFSPLLLVWFHFPSLWLISFFFFLTSSPLVITPAATVKKFCWGELVNLRGPEKAKQNRLLCFLSRRDLQEVGRGRGWREEGLNAAESCNLETSDQIVLKASTQPLYKNTMSRSQQRLMTAVVA